MTSVHGGDPDSFISPGVSDEIIKQTVSKALGHRVSVLSSAQHEVSTKICALNEKIDNSTGIRGFLAK